MVLVTELLRFLPRRFERLTQGIARYFGGFQLQTQCLGMILGFLKGTAGLGELFAGCAVAINLAGRLVQLRQLVTKVFDFGGGSAARCADALKRCSDLVDCGQEDL
ncbi:hypothetical protein ACUHMQ_18320 [Chitinimonas sp. PSY-7]|uniref:hypothetical protein n=1 Tax=Chitinimonas sp. PSY-7 TaxID=3459088 RepID=UPI0040401674